MVSGGFALFPRTFSKKRAGKEESELIGATRILREPAFPYTFFLLEYLLDAPEGGEGEDTQQRREQDVVQTEGSCHAGNAQQQENPPAAGTPIVLGLDDNGVEDADDEERTDADEQA